MISTLVQDIRLAARVLRKSPGFTAVAVSALALAIGANTAIFSVINRVLLQPLPYKDPDSLVRVVRTFREGTGDSISIPKLTHWKAGNRVFQSMAAYDFAGPGLNLGGTDTPEQINGIHASHEYFAVFGATPVLGRTYSADEDRPGGPRVIVMSYGLWKRRFGADPNIIGRAINLNGEPHTVIGVLSQRFLTYPSTDLWMPLEPDPNSTNHGHYLNVAARLKPGVTLQAAKAQMKIVGEQFRRTFPGVMGDNESVGVIPMQEKMVADVRPALMILGGAVVFVLLTACANVANLLLARAAARSREIAIRTALGARRGRLIQQLLTEAVLLSTIAGAIGLLLGVWGVRALLALSPGNIPRAAELSDAPFLALLDLRILAFTVALSFLTGILFGLVPALQISKPDLNSTLKENSSRTTTGRQHFARSALVVSEMAFALVLLIGSALLIRTFLSLRSVDVGMDFRNVLTLQTSLAGSRFNTTAPVEALTIRMLQRLESLPGVQAATSSISVPLEGGVDLPFVIEGRPPTNGPFHGDVQWRYASPHYFQALKVPLMRGRVFNEQDTGKAPPVVIINETMARKFWDKADPIGRRITIGKGLGPEFDDPPRQIIGVVGNVRENGLDQPFTEVMYIPFGQVPNGLTALGNKVVPVAWLIRTSADPRGLAKAVEKEFLSADAQLPVAKVRTVQEVVAETTARQNFNMLLLTIFAAVALVLAAIGIYGVMAYSVQQRTHEMGIRMALGAGAGDLLRLVVGHGLRLAAIGVVAGTLAAYGLTRLLASLLFGVKPTDVPTFAAVALTLSLVAFLASYIPARRAARIDPLIALRYE